MEKRPRKKLEEMKQAWLVQWSCHAQNEKKYLKQLGIKEKVVDVISARKDFDKQIIDIGIDIYRRGILSFSEKVYLSNYSLGEKRKKEFFSINVPVVTHYQSGVYRNLMKSIQEKGIGDKDTKRLGEQWRKCPQYVHIGHNPFLEIIKVFNLSVSKKENGNEIVEWDRPLADGSFEKEKYEFKK